MRKPAASTKKPVKKPAVKQSSAMGQVILHKVVSEIAVEHIMCTLNVC